MSAESGSETLVSEPRGSVSVSSEAPCTAVTLNELLTLLDVPHLELNNDEEHVLRHGRSVEGAAMSHAALMIRCSQVQHLLRTHEAGIVLVEGCGDRSQMSRVSPISVVCATLAHTLRTRPSSATLLFFCGRHLADDDNLCGPQGLMRSFLVQLILILVQNNWISDFTQINLMYAEGEFKYLNLQDVCQLFHQLLEYVSPKAEVFCLIDGISFFEGEDWFDDYDLAMGTFGRIIADQNLSSVFKLLLTTPTRSTRLSDMAPHQRVQLRNNGAQVSLQAALRTATW